MTQVVAYGSQSLAGLTRRVHGRRNSPGELDDSHGVYEADSERADTGRVGRALHLESDQIVGEQDSPNLLADQFGTLASNRLFPEK